MPWGYIRKHPYSGDLRGSGGTGQGSGTPLGAMPPGGLRRSQRPQAPPALWPPLSWVGSCRAWEPRDLLGSGHRSRSSVGSGEEGPSGKPGWMDVGTTARSPLTLASPGQRPSGRASRPHPWPGPITAPRRAGRGGQRPKGDEGRSERRDNQLGGEGLQSTGHRARLVTSADRQPRRHRRQGLTARGVHSEQPHLHAPCLWPGLPPTTPTFSP